MSQRYHTSRSGLTSRTVKGYISTKSNIQTRFPFVEDGIDRDGVMRILENAGIGLPKYYEWRTRSGCYFCFYQRKAEWIGLAERHPELFERAVAIEQKVLQDAGVAGDADFRDRAMRGRQYTWSGGETLTELKERKARSSNGMNPQCHEPRIRNGTFPWFKSWGTRWTRKRTLRHVRCAPCDADGF